ncbi:MAG TPA: hypothetical protein VFB80_01795 [Pirellulaceae bacterium]|nr:hypothetical protein [Pirellulaceae bacterium]
MTVEFQGPHFLRRPAEAVGIRIFHRPTRLFLRGPDYTDAAALHLARLTSLQSLTLDGTNISAAAVERLRHALPHCQIEHRH